MQIEKLITFKNWADDVYLDYIADLTDEQFSRPITEKSIREILIHIYEVYWSWYRTMTTKNYDGEPDWDKISKNDLITGIKSINKDMLELSKNGDLKKDIVLQWSKDDNPVHTNPENILFNAVNHSAYHRGQIALKLRNLGLPEIKETDYNPYIYELGQK